MPLARLLGGCFVFAVCALYLVNASWLAAKQSGERTYLAHRGVHQLFDRAALGPSDCTAERIFPMQHDFIENTIPSMRAAFDHGAAIVELDVHPTTDGDFAVFHDWELDCRTNGAGVTREHTLADLQALDAGYGYTPDGGATYPLRGAGVGLIPSFNEVLTTFPDRRFLIHIKSDDPREGDLLANYLSARPEADLRRLSFYGGDRPIARLRARMPSIRAFTKRSIKECGVAYLTRGWTGLVPAACRNTVLVVPSNYVRLMWGWPDRFEARMRAAGAEVYVSGPFDRNEAFGGLNSLAELQRLPRSWKGGVWTDRIEIINPGAEAAGR